MKVLNSYWFIGGGIVMVEDETGDVRYYIRGIDSGRGGSQEQDELTIAEWGSSFPASVGDKLFGVE